MALTGLACATGPTHRDPVPSRTSSAPPGVRSAVVGTLPGAPPAPRELEATSPERGGFEASIRDVEALLRARRAREAAHRCELALRGLPEGSVRATIQRLHHQALAMELADDWLTASLVAPRTAWEIGEAITFDVRLSSRRDTEIEIPRDRLGTVSPSEVSRSVVRLTIDYEELDHFASAVTYSWEERIEIDSDLTLAPWGRIDLGSRLDSTTPRFHPARPVYRRLTVRGTVRPAALVDPDAGEHRFGSLDVGPLFLEVYPKRYRAFSLDADARLRTALERADLEPGYLPHILFGTLFLSRSRPEDARALLAGATTHAGPDLREAVSACLDLLDRREFEWTVSSPHDRP